jgi:hypothetical protein
MQKIITKSNHEILVDDDFFKKYGHLSWQLNSVGYARRTIRYKKKYRTLLMHRCVMNAQKNEIVDHINGNKLDNRRANLRICTQSDNLRNARKGKDNTSGFKGVWRDKRRKTRSWIAEVLGLEGEKIYLGSADTPQDAYKLIIEWNNTYLDIWK